MYEKEYEKWKYYKKQINHNRLIYYLKGNKALIMKYYREKQGYEYDFNNPVLFTEKINTRKNQKNKLYTLCADKIKVRDYVAKKIGKKYLIPCYFTANKFTKKLFDSMPNSCVLKTASGSGTIKVVYDKKKENKEELVKLMKFYQSIKFHYIWGEIFYRKIKNKIICEKLLLTKEGKVPTDIKVHCFKNGGKNKFFIQLDFDRFSDHRRNIYDENFKLLDLICGFENYKGNVKKPDNWDEILRVAKKLSEDFEYVRVDLYNLNGKIYFGELTFTNASGLTKFNPNKYNKMWGSYWK